MNDAQDHADLMNRVEGKLAALRESTFPSGRLSACEGHDGLPLLHMAMAAELLSFIQESISLAHQHEDEWGFTAQDLLHIGVNPPRGLLIDCTSLHIPDTFSMEENILEDFGWYYIEFDFSRSLFKHMHIRFESYAKRVEFILNATTILGSGDISLQKSSATIYATDFSVKKIFRTSGSFDLIEIKRSEIALLEIHGARIRRAHIINCNISDGINVRRVTILEDISFRESRIKLIATFDDCKFVLPPDFHDVSAPSETAFLHTEYGLAKDKKRSEVFITNKQIMNDTPGRFRALRLAMKKAGAQHEEAEFFAQELRSRRRAALSSESHIRMDMAEITISWLYDQISAFGTSIWRALLSFILWNFAFWWVFYIFEIFFCNNKQCFLINKNLESKIFSEHPALTIAMQNALNPLSIFASNAFINANSITLLALSLLQSIGSVGIAALLLLAIKGRFQRGGGGSSA